MPETGVSQPPPRRPFQFSLATLMGVTALCSVLSAALGGMLRGRGVGSQMPPGFFVMMAAAAPVAVVIAASLYVAAKRFLARRR